MTTRPTFILSADQSDASVLLLAQGDRSVLTAHTVSATLRAGASSVAWTSSTGTFDSAISLTPTYTPTTIAYQEVVCTPSGPLGAGAPAVEAWEVSRPLPVAANATTSTPITSLTLQTEALSDTGGADLVTWLTVVQRYTTGGTFQGTETVTSSTTTAPTWTPSSLSRVFRVTSTATDAYGRTSNTVRAVGTSTASSSPPTGNIGSDTSQSTLASVTLDGSAIVGATSYLWSIEVLKPADATYTSTAAPLAATLQTTSFTPDGPGDWRIKCVATNATGSTTFERQVSQTRPYPAPSSTLGSTVYMAAGTYAPTLSDTGGADGVTWVTSATKVTDGSSVTITNSTTTTPTFTAVVGTAYRVRQRSTDAYARVVDYVASVDCVPSWHTVLDYDATAISTFGALAVGNNVIGALTWEVAVSVGSATIAHTNGTGITVSVASATNTQALRANVAGLMNGPGTNIFRICMVVDSISWTAVSQYIPMYVGSNAQPTTGSMRVPIIGGRLWRTSSVDHRMRSVSNGTGSTIGGTNAVSQSAGVTIDAGSPTQAVFVHYCYGPQGAVLVTTGTTTIPAADTDPLNNVFEPNVTYNRMSYMAAIADRTTAIDCWPAVYVGPHITGASGTYSYIIKRFLVEEWY